MASRDARLETRRRTPGPSDRSSAPPNDDAPSDDDAPPEGPRASRGEPAGDLDPDPDPDPTPTALAAARDPSALAEPSSAEEAALAVASASSLPSSPSADAASASASSSLSLREQKLKLAATSRRVATLRKKLDDIPSPLETAQYERRIAELHALARRRHAEHREAFEDYNALCDELETLRKELGILDSLRSQLGLSPEPPGPGGDRDDDARVPAGWTIDAETREAVARSLLSVESGVGRATAAARARARRAGEGLREARRRVREAEAAERKYLETLRA